MAEENYDEDIFADLYDDDGEPTAAAESAPAAVAEQPKSPTPAKQEPEAGNGTTSSETMQDAHMNDTNGNANIKGEWEGTNGDMNGAIKYEGAVKYDDNDMHMGVDESYEPIGMKEDG